MQQTVDNMQELDVIKKFCDDYEIALNRGGQGSTPGGSPGVVCLLCRGGCRYAGPGSLSAAGLELPARADSSSTTSMAST